MLWLCAEGGRGVCACHLLRGQEGSKEGCGSESLACSGGEKACRGRVDGCVGRRWCVDNV